MDEELRELLKDVFSELKFRNDILRESRAEADRFRWEASARMGRAGVGKEGYTDFSKRLAEIRDEAVSGAKAMQDAAEKNQREHAEWREAVLAELREIKMLLKNRKPQ